MLCYFVAYLDRVNEGFTALTMSQDLGISSTAFGFGAEIFFFSYFVFEMPSNLALVYFGAVATTYGTAFWLPWIVKGFGPSNLMTGLVAAIPYIGGTIGMVVVLSLHHDTALEQAPRRLATVRS